MTRSEMSEAWNLTPRRQRTEGYNLIFLRGVEFVYSNVNDEWVRRDVHDREREQREQQARSHDDSIASLTYTIPRTYTLPPSTTFFNIVDDAPPPVPMPPTLEQRIETAEQQAREARSRHNYIAAVRLYRTAEELREQLRREQQQTNNTI